MPLDGVIVVSKIKKQPFTEKYSDYNVEKQIVVNEMKQFFNFFIAGFLLQNDIFFH